VLAEAVKLAGALTRRTLLHIPYPQRLCRKVVVACTAVGVSCDKSEEGPLLSSFRGVQREFSQNADGTYHFAFSLPHQERQEQRDEDGKVTGYFAFVDKSGEEFSLHFDADEEGYQPESDNLPQAPEDTEDVQNAREEFLRYYEQTAKFLSELGSEEDSGSYSSSEEDEYEDEDSSSEEDEDSDESEEEEDEEEEEEEEKSNGRFASHTQRRTNEVFRTRNDNRNRAQRVPSRFVTSRDKTSKFPPRPAAASIFGRRT
ncbi:hypothetical protein SK128_016264, partial [Halocaridina rubra]